MLPDFGFMQSPSYAEKHEEMGKSKPLQHGGKEEAEGIKLCKLTQQFPVAPSLYFEVIHMIAFIC